MITMKNNWQLNILFMVLLITSCFGGPITPIKSNKTLILLNNVDDSKIKNLTENSIKSEEIDVESNKLASVASKLGEVNSNLTESVGDSKTTSSVTNKDKIIWNYNVKTNSTAEGSKDVNEVVSATDNVLVSASAVNPSVSAQVEGNASDVSSIADVAVKQDNIEGDNQPAADIKNVDTTSLNLTSVSDNTGMVNIATKDDSSKVTNEAGESNITTEDEKLPSEGDEVILEKNTTNDAQESLGLTKEDKPEPVKTEDPEPKPEPNNKSDSNTNKPEPEIAQFPDPKPEPSDNSESNTKLDIQESSADSNSNVPTDNQVQPTSDSESNSQTNNQETIADVSNKSPNDVSDQTHVKVVASKSSTTTTQSSFNVYMGDSSATYPQNSDQDYPASFRQYTGNDNEPSYDDISEDGGINSVDTQPYDKERGEYKNEQQKLSGEFTDDTDSHFFAYFLTIMVSAIVFYLLFHNKQRIIALIIEGRASPRSRRSSRRTKYHKLDNNLEEAMVHTKESTRFDGLY